ncbi:hypothetical protein [Halorubrum sp. DM2]|nr:hypothetical protein [Halorubrum sp. DM2]
MENSLRRRLDAIVGLLAVVALTYTRPRGLIRAWTSPSTTRST